MEFIAKLNDLHRVRLSSLSSNSPLKESWTKKRKLQSDTKEAYPST